jgi:DNA topoisomerase-1
LFANLEVEKLAARKRVMKEAINAVSEALGNTPTVCRKYYIHSGLLDEYVEGALPEYFLRFMPSRSGRLSREEQILARFLRRWSPLN